MEHSRRTRRVSFSDAGQGKLEDVTRSRARAKSESFRTRQDYNGKESDLAASIAAAAHAIYCLEGKRAEYEQLMVDSFRESFGETSFRDPKSRTNSFHLQQFDDPPYLGTSARHSSLRDMLDHGESRDIRRSTTRPIEIGGQTSVRKVETKADAWEQARLDKINKWYEKMNRKIQEWEKMKKKKAEFDMERRKAELDRLMRLNLHHYQNKTERIEDVSGGARKHLEEKKRSEEAYARDKARKIRSTGKVPVQCLCFEY